MATPATPKVFKNFINGEWVEARSGKAIENRNPANTAELVGMFPASTTEDVNLAIDAAKAAYDKWRLTPAPKRAEILYRAAEILIERKEDYSRDMTREMGKVLAETRGDVQEAIDMTYLMAGEGRRQFGQTTPSELPNKFAMSVRTPVGVAGLITSLEFSDGHPILESDARAGHREHRRHQAGRGLAAIHLQFDAGAHRSRPAARRDERGIRRRPGRRRATSQS